MTPENFKRANEIAETLRKISEAINDLQYVRTDSNLAFNLSDSNYQAYFGAGLIDPMAKEGCKALVLSNLEGKKKQLEAEFEKL